MSAGEVACMAGAKRGGGSGEREKRKRGEKGSRESLKCPFSFWPIEMVIKIKPRELLSHQNREIPSTN